MSNEITLQLVFGKVHLDGRLDGWRFSDGEVEFSASVLDHEFIEQVRSRKIAFGFGDSIEARLCIEQYRDDSQRLRTERSVTEVLRFIPAGRVEAEEGGQTQKGSYCLCVDSRGPLIFRAPGISQDLLASLGTSGVYLEV